MSHKLTPTLATLLLFLSAFLLSYYVTCAQGSERRTGADGTRQMTLNSEATPSRKPPKTKPPPPSPQSTFEIPRGSQGDPWTYYMVPSGIQPSQMTKLEDFQKVGATQLAKGQELKDVLQGEKNPFSSDTHYLVATASLPLTSYENKPLPPTINSKKAVLSALHMHLGPDLGQGPSGAVNITDILYKTIHMSSAQWEQGTRHSIIQVRDSEPVKNDLVEKVAALFNETGRENYYLQERTFHPNAVFRFAKPTAERFRGKANVKEIRWELCPTFEAPSTPGPGASKTLVVMERGGNTVRKDEPDLPALIPFGKVETNKVLQFVRPHSTANEFSLKTNSIPTAPKFTLFAFSDQPDNFHLHLHDIGISNDRFKDSAAVGSDTFNLDSRNTNRNRGRGRRDVQITRSRPKRECSWCTKRRSKDLSGGELTERKQRRIQKKETELSDIERGGDSRAQSGHSPDKAQSTDSEHMASSKSKSKRVSQALDTGKSIGSGGIGELSRTARQGMGRSIKLGANAVKSGFYKLKTGLERISNSRGSKKLDKFSGKPGVAFLLKDLGGAIREKNGPRIVMMAGMTVRSIVSSKLGDIKPLSATSKCLVAIGKGIGGLVNVAGGVLSDVVAVVNSHECGSNSRRNTDLCVRGDEGCVEEYSICDGKDAMTEMVTSYAQLGLGLVSTVLSYTKVFAPVGALIDLFARGLTFYTDHVQALNQLQAFAQYFPLTRSERSSHLGFVNVHILGFSIEEKLMEMREQAKTNARGLEDMGGFLGSHSATFWAYFRPAFTERVQTGTTTVRNEEHCKTESKGTSFFGPLWGVAKFGGGAIGYKYGACLEEVPVYDYPVYEDNTVDVTDWTGRYFERWSPNPSERIINYKPNKFTDDNFFCRPEGARIDITYNYFPWLHGFSYRCVNSLGYKHQEPTPALSALFNLDDGTDIAVGFKSHPNYFVVGNGRKDFRGGDERDAFHLAGSWVSGRLDGGGGVDSIALGRNSFSGAIVQLILRMGKQILIIAGAELELIGIERIEGREGVADVIHVACHNTYIDGRGGSSSAPDQIHVGEQNSCHGMGSPEHVQVVVPPLTTLTSYNRGSAAAQYVYTVTLRAGTNVSDRSLESTIRILPGLGLGQHHVLLPVPLHQISILRNEKSQYERRVELAGAGLNFVGAFINSAQVHVTTSDEALFSYMDMDDAHKSSFFLFNLVNSVSQNVVGAEHYANYFHIQNAYTSITGGRLGDTFLFATDKRVGSIRGGSGGSNTIILSDSLQAQCIVNLERNEIVFTPLNGYVSKTKLAGTFETVVGREGKEDTLVAACGVKSIDLKRGRGSKPDRVIIPDMHCSHPPRMTIAVPPFTIVENTYRDPAHFTYVIPKSNPTGGSGDRFLYLAAAFRAQHVLHLAQEPRTLRAVSYDSFLNTLRLNGTGSGFSLEIQLPPQNIQKNVRIFFNEFTVLELEPGKQQGRIEPLFVFDLSASSSSVNDSTSAAVVGAPNSVNKFHIDRPIAEVVGGVKNDIFYLRQNGRVDRMEGAGGNDVLVLSLGNNKTSMKYTIDLSSHISISNSSEEGGFRLRFRFRFRTQLSGNFTHFYGPSVAVQSITAACPTQLISLDGDNSVEPLPLRSGNRIRIPRIESPACSYDLVIHLPTHPSNSLVLNGATRGVFKYVVPSSGTEFVVHRVVPENVTSAEDLNEFEENVTQLFVLNVTLFEIEDIAGDLRRQKVNLTYSDGQVSSFQIAHVSSEDSLVPLKLVDDPELKETSDEEAEENDTSRAAAEFHYQFITKDGYEVTVNHVGGLHAVKTMEGSMDSEEIFDLIQNHVELANDLGMTIILSTLNERGAQAQFIHIGGDDEMDFLINQDSAESHLVGNTMGQRNVFYVAPTLNNHPIYVYLPTNSATTPSTTPNSPLSNETQPESEFDELQVYYDHPPSSVGENLLQFSSLYDRRPPHVDPALYEPRIYFPTIAEEDGDLIITAKYDPNPHYIRNENTTRKLKKETVTFVNGVRDYYRLKVKLFSILYKIDFDWEPIPGNSNANQNQNETHETETETKFYQDSRVWRLRPQRLYFEKAPAPAPAPAPDSEDTFASESTAKFHSDENDDYPLGNTSDRESGEDKDGIAEPTLQTRKIGKKRTKRVTPDDVTILSYADIMEYKVADIPLQLPPHLTSRDNVFGSGDDILLTNNLALPNLNMYNKYLSPDHDDGDGDGEEDENGPGTSILILGMKKAIAEKNLTLAFTLTDPTNTNSTRNESSFQVTPETIANALPDVAVAQAEFIEAQQNFDKVLVQVQSIGDGDTSEFHFDASVNASEGVDVANLDFISDYSNFTNYFDHVAELEAGFVWVHRNHGKGLRGVKLREAEFREAHSNVVDAYKALTAAEQRYNSSRADVSLAMTEMKKEGNDFQSSYDHLQLALRELEDGKKNFTGCTHEFWEAIENVNRAEMNFLASYAWYTAILDEVRVQTAKCARRKLFM